MCLFFEISLFSSIMFRIDPFVSRNVFPQIPPDRRGLHPRRKTYAECWGPSGVPVPGPVEQMSFISYVWGVELYGFRGQYAIY